MRRIEKSAKKHSVPKSKPAHIVGGVFVEKLNRTPSSFIFASFALFHILCVVGCFVIPLVIISIKNFIMNSEHNSTVAYAEAQTYTLISADNVTIVTNYSVLRDIGILDHYACKFFSLIWLTKNKVGVNRILTMFIIFLAFAGFDVAIPVPQVSGEMLKIIVDFCQLTASKPPYVRHPNIPAALELEHYDFLRKHEKNFKSLLRITEYLMIPRLMDAISAYIRSFGFVGQPFEHIAKQYGKDPKNSMHKYKRFQHLLNKRDIIYFK